MDSHEDSGASPWGQGGLAEDPPPPGPAAASAEQSMRADAAVMLPQGRPDGAAVAAMSGGTGTTDRGKDLGNYWEKVQERAEKKCRRGLGNNYIVKS